LWRGDSNNPSGCGDDDNGAGPDHDNDTAPSTAHNNYNDPPAATPTDNHDDDCAPPAPTGAYANGLLHRPGGQLLPGRGGLPGCSPWPDRAG